MPSHVGVVIGPPVIDAAASLIVSVGFRVVLGRFLPVFTFGEECFVVVVAIDGPVVFLVWERVLRRGRFVCGLFIRYGQVSEAIQQHALIGVRDALVNIVWIALAMTNTFWVVTCRAAVAVTRCVEEEDEAVRIHTRVETGLCDVRRR